MRAILLIALLVLVVLLVGCLPSWPYSRRWAYGPSGFVGLLVLMLLALMLTVGCDAA